MTVCLISWLESAWPDSATLFFICLSSRLGPTEYRGQSRNSVIPANAVEGRPGCRYPGIQGHCVQLQVSMPAALPACAEQLHQCIARMYSSARPAIADPLFRPQQTLISASDNQTWLITCRHLIFPYKYDRGMLSRCTDHVACLLHSRHPVE